MFTIYLKKNYKKIFNLKKNESCTIINYIKIILILYLININILINILIKKKNKIVIYKFIFYLCQVYI